MGLRTKVFAALTALTLAFAMPAEAGREKGERGRGKVWAEAMKELNLTSEQQAKMKELNQKKHDELGSKRNAMKQAREDLHNALKGTAPDADVRQKFESLQKLQDEFARARFEHVLAVRAVLTPEQREKFHGKLKATMKHMRGHDHDGDDD